MANMCYDSFQKGGIDMFTHPLEQEEYERRTFARRYPEAYNTLIEQEQEHRRKTAENPDALDRLIGRIKRFFRKNQ
jgi:hypothetical protein